MNSHHNVARLRTLALLLIICGSVSSFAQEAKQEKRVPLVPTGLSLEVNTKEGPIGYNSIPGEFYGGRYRRLASWKPDANAPQVEIFEVRYVMEGVAVRVRVYAWTDKFGEQKELIGNYLLSEGGGKVAVQGMMKFGYEPMEFAVVNVKPAPLVAPEAMSRIPSVAVVSVEIKQSNFPSYNLTLRNLSEKDITHLEIQTFKENRLTSSRWPREDFNRPLVKAGETYEVTLSAMGGQKTPDGFTPSPPQQLVVTTAVFKDKSYEGDPQQAARFLAMLHGQKLQIKRALALLQYGPDAPANLENFKQQVSLLERSASQEMIDEVFASFPGRTPRWNEGLKAYMESGMGEVRKELLSDTEKYGQTIAGGAGSKSFDAWLGELRQKYEAWLSRL
jgi:hypothetical protein